MKNLLILAAVIGMTVLASCGSKGDDDGKSIVAVRDSATKSQADSIAKAMKDSMANLQSSNKN